MKYFVVLVLFIFCPVCMAQFASDSSTKSTEYSDQKMFRQTRNALLKYDFIQKRTEYWGKRLEKMLLGDYGQKVLIIAPLVTGKLEFNALDLNFYIDARAEKSGVRYTYNF